MEAVSIFSRLYSHPDKPLEVHLTNVADIALRNLEDLPIEKIGFLTKAKIFRLVEICTYCHDLGKATGYFQKYLFSEESERDKLKAMEETHHSLLSSIISSSIASVEFKDDYELTEEQKLITSFIAFSSVKRHHGDLRDAREESILDDEEESLLIRQIDSIDDVKFSILISNLKKNGFSQDLDKNVLKEDVYLTRERLKIIRRLFRRLDGKENIWIYILNNLIFSLLIDADKNEVGVKSVIRRRKIELPHAIVDNYKSNLNINRDEFINQLREKAYREVLSNKIELNQKFYSINLPTGLGKTFASIAFALKLREILYQERGYFSRVIYALPFLSIIDQNANEIDKILNFNKIPVDTDIFLKHHHLSDISYKVSDNEFETEEARLLIEGWNSEIIITTFVQLFHTLISNRNRLLLKFHRLAGSIIILDEVQAIPFKYWNLLEELFEYLTVNFDCYIIFVTATQPFIISREKLYPLVNSREYFLYMDRVVLNILIEKQMTLGEFINNLDIEEDKRYLFILNTIRSSKDFYELIKNKTNEEIIYLSTHVTPYDRLERIKKIKDKKIRLAVTTQLVEAGVDIDFDVVYRDMAPLDSIIQAIGRCNRNWGDKKGICNLIELRDERRTYASYIYDYLLLDITKKILSGRRSIEERNFLDVINTYYKEVVDKKSSDTSRDFIDAICSLKYTGEDEKKSIEDFKLIEEEYQKIDIFIEQNEEAERLWGRYCDLKEIKSIIERRIEFSRIKAAFYKYVISVPLNRLENIPPVINGFAYVGKNVLKDYYEEDTGFKCKAGTILW